ncbi:MAG: ABC transporter substrate-binding protein [Deltaproteobacteria bacterium]|nr:ABC transporter substrate-binding protein [Deltaproteobacteria bacterium]
MKKTWLLLSSVLLFAVAVPAFYTTPAFAEDNYKSEFRVALAGFGDVPTLDPARAATAAPVLIGWQVYQRLIDVTPNGNIAPMLATHWSSNPEMTVWRFSLRKNVFFHSSPGKKPRKLTTADVKASIERALRAPGYGRSVIGDLVKGAKEFIEEKAKTVAGITINNGDIVFTLTRPFAFFPERLASSFFAILPADTEMEDMNPPGTGPYQIMKWDRLTGKVTLKLNSKNWIKVSAQSPQRLTFQIFESEPLAVEELRAGNIDWLEASSSARRLVTEGLDPERYTINTPVYNDIRIIAINQTINRFTKYREIAAALNFAVNRDRIVQVLGGGKVVGGPIPSGDYEHYGYWTDTHLARLIVKSLPTEARHIELLVQPGTESRLIAELVAEDWRGIGMKVSLKQGMSDFFDRVVRGDYQAALGYFGPFIDTPEQYLWPYQITAKPVPNVMSYESPSFQEAYQHYVSEPDPSKRLIHLQLALDILLRDAPMIWLVKAPHIVASKRAFSVPRTGGMPLFFKLVSN